ncbi:hypothetical protein OIY81_1555 [Cryptosporidium canis]|nr:hypothetical protein OIY81_1555 [Cryptosporidium canis]
MLKNLSFRPPARSFIACCIEFRERQEFCRANIIPLLLKRLHASGRRATKCSSGGSEKALPSKKELRRLIREITNVIRTSPRKRRPSIREWMGEVKSLIKAREDAANKRLGELQNRILEAKVDYSRSIILNESELDAVVGEMNSLVQRLDGLNFRQESVIERISSQELRKMEILSQAREYLGELLVLSDRVQEVSKSIRDSSRLRSSKIYELLSVLRECLDSLGSIEGEMSLRLNVKDSIYGEISGVLDYILEVLVSQIASFLREYCDWGQLDKIVQQVLSRKSTNVLSESPDLSRIEKNEGISQSIGVLLVLASICIDLGYTCREMRDSGVDGPREGDRYPRRNACEEIIPRLGDEIANKLKPLFFSRSSSLSNPERPEWLLETYLSIFKSHSSYLKGLWRLLGARLSAVKSGAGDDSARTYTSKYVPFYMEREEYLRVMGGILAVDPSKVLSISLICNLEAALRAFLRRSLSKDGVAIRDNKVDCIFEKLVEHLLILYRQWREVEAETAMLITADLLTNLNVNRLVQQKKGSVDGLLEDGGVLQIEDISKTAVSWAKSAFTLVMGSPDSEYLEMFNRPSTFPPECGILDWYCILNRIYIAGQTLGYLSESLISSYVDKFNMKRTIQDLYSSICSHCGSSDQSVMLKWLADTVVYISSDSSSQNAQALVMPIKSSSSGQNGSGSLILVLGYSIEVVELLNAFSGKVSQLVDSCICFERSRLRISDWMASKYPETKMGLSHYPPKVFSELFSTPIIDQSIVGEFVGYIRGEWNRVGHKIGPMIPMISILLESVDVVYFTLVNLREDVGVRGSTGSGPRPEEGESRDGAEYTLKMYDRSTEALREIKEEMIRDIKLELTEVIIKPLVYSEITIPSLGDLLSSSTFSGNARLLFDENLAKKVNELKHAFLLFSLFLSSSNLTEISNVLSV